jgi:hypothetical protein
MPRGAGEFKKRRIGLSFIAFLSPGATCDTRFVTTFTLTVATLRNIVNTLGKHVLVGVGNDPIQISAASHSSKSEHDDSAERRDGEQEGNAKQEAEAAQEAGDRGF